MKGQTPSRSKHSVRCKKCFLWRQRCRGVRLSVYSAEGARQDQRVSNSLGRVTAIPARRCGCSRWFVRNFNFVPSTNEERQEIIRLALNQLSSWAKPGAKIVVLMENTRKLENNPDEKDLRQRYNNFIVSMGKALDNLTYIDINTVTRIDWLFDDGFHMRREGYYELAQAVTRVFDSGQHHEAGAVFASLG
jgi:hypothetical protein